MTLTVLWIKVMNFIKSLLQRFFKVSDIITETEPPKEVLKVDSKDYTTLPLPIKDASMEAAVPLLKAVESILGTNAKTMALIIDLESNFRTNVKAKTSSALGWFQLINGTYDTLLKRHSKKYGIPLKSTVDMRTDPRVSTLLGAELLNETTSFIRPVLGREPTVLESYIGHFLGAPTAKKFLAIKDESAVAADLMPKEARANTWVFYESNGKGRARTVAEVKASLQNRIAKSLIQVDKYFN